jgi:hypothetical protein
MTWWSQRRRALPSRSNMQALSTSDLLAVWEQGLLQPPGEWALSLLAAANPGTPPAALARLTVGQRDAMLLTLREWTFGSRLASVVDCPACGKRLELEFDLADIRVPALPPALPEPVGPPERQSLLRPARPAEPVPEVLSLTAGDYELSFRLPNSQDLVALAGHNGQQDVATVRQQLLERCLLQARYRGEERAADQLPMEVVDAVAARMVEADPQADVELALSCPACGQQWSAAFDILSFFWTDVDAWARRTLRDVHQLARAYGWAEADILAMSPWRRQVYLDMIGG